MTMMMVGPWASKSLGALGADVLRVVQPDVDWGTLGGAPPTINGTAGGYIAWNMNKRSIFLDLKSEEDGKFARELLRTCDVFLCNMRTGVPERLGLGTDELFALNPRIICCYATGYGRTGPRANDPAMDDPVQVMSGFWSTQGARGGLPEMYRHHTQMDASSGNFTAAAIVLALAARARTGRGQIVDMTMFDASATLQLPRISEHLAGYDHVPLGSSAFATAPNRAFLCLDQRWIGVGVTTDTQWRALCHIPELAELGVLSEYATTFDRVTNRERLETTLTSIFASRPQSYWVINLTKRNVPFGISMGWEALRDHPQARENGYLTDVETVAWGTVTTGGGPWEFSKTPTRLFSPPMPGFDTFDVHEEVDALARLGGDTAAAPLGEDESAARPSEPALFGVRVVELAEEVAGPMTGRLLGDAGADVIKVERDGGDPARGWGAVQIDGTSAVFLALNRNKRSVGFGVGDPAFEQLLATADVLVVDKGQIDVDRTMADHPDLIVCVVSGWGPRGPWSDRPGGELPAQLASEATTSLGRIGDEPVRLGNEHAGVLTAVYATQAIAAALLVVGDVGGQRIDVSLFGSMVEMRSTLWVALSDPDEWGGFHLDHEVKPPEYGYTCADGRIWFNLARLDDFDALITDLDMDFARADPRWEVFRWDRAGVDRNVHVVYDIWDAGLSKWSVAEASAILDRHGALVFPLNSFDAFLEDPQSKYLGMVVEYEDGSGRKLRDLRPPWQIAGAPSQVRCGPPGLGEHTEEILAELATDLR
jgi:crotonobetainyl-CoA:carnitine CoA-transferase CaiB-like acyl-CoA transferase